MPRIKSEAPPDILREMIRYEGGQIYWTKAYQDKRKKRFDTPAGSTTSTGYRILRVTIDGVKRSFAIHRLIWWLVNDEWPLMLDHINRNRSDNRIENLRKATESENSRNRTINRNNKSGFQSVSKYRKNYRFVFSYNDLKIYKYGYETPEAAALARDTLCHLLYGDFAVYNILDKPSLKIIHP